MLLVYAGWSDKHFLSNFSEFCFQDETGGALRLNNGNVFLCSFSSFCQGHLDSRIYTCANREVAAVFN